MSDHDETTPPSPTPDTPDVGRSASRADRPTTPLGSTPTGTSAADTASNTVGLAAQAAQAAGKTGGGIGDAVVGEAAAMTKAIAERDGMAAAESATRAAAVAAGTYFGGTAGGEAVQRITKTETGRKLTRGVAFLVYGVIAMLVILIATAGFAAMAGGMALTQLLGAQKAAACAANLSGDSAGLIETDLGRQQIAADIIATAYKANLGQKGAILGVMAAMTESQLRPGLVDATQPATTPGPLKSVGVFQQKPWYTAREVWPANAVVGDKYFNDPVLLAAAIAKVKTTSYAAGKFYAALNTDPVLSGGKWQTMDPWAVAQQMLQSDFADGSNYKAMYASAVATSNAIVTSYPDLKTGTPVVLPVPADGGADPTAGCGFDATGADGNYTIAPSHPTRYRDAGIVFPGTGIAMNRAMAFVGHAELACSDGMCVSMCDHLAGEIWGYSNSGYLSARYHWQSLLAAGKGHPGDMNPPIGALLFWNTGPYGHVAVYVGDGMVVSNLRGSNGNNVYLMPADWWTDRVQYYGWGEPIFRGARIPDAGF